MINRRQAIALPIAATLTSLTALPAVAQSGASRTTRLLVGFPPGGTSDVLARALTRGLSGPDTTVIVENKPGAGGRIAVTEMLSSPADGRTLLMTADPIMVIYPHVFPKLAYRPATDVTPVAPVASEPLALVVGPMVPPEVQNLAGFIEWCKRRPAQSSYATAGAGTTMHFLGAMLARATQAPLVHIPHRGAAAALQDVIAGQIAATMTPLSQVVPHLGNSRLRVLAVSSATRMERLRATPTFAELGFPTLTVLVYYGVYAASSVPPGLIASWHTAVRSAAQTPEFRNTLERLSLDSYELDQKAFADLMRKDIERWKPIVQATGYTAED